MTTTDAVSQDVEFNEKFVSSLYEIENGERIRACIQCGTCAGVCPYSYRMEFSPRRMISAFRAEAFSEILDTDTVWLCMSCFACTAFCPQQIPLTNGLMARAKEELLLVGKVPKELQDALQNSQRYGNALGESPRKRVDWTIGLDPEIPIMKKIRRPVDVLWYVGDYASYHPRVQLVTKAMEKIFSALKVDYGILGNEENCDGDTQRLAGERGLFEVLAEKNGEVLSTYEFNEIVTTDPHAYNAFKNEYPGLGITYPVKHYTQYLSERLDDLKPILTKVIKAKVTYHDACYLGRANGIYDEPRQLLQNIPGLELVEMAHHHKDSLCCGGGGGGMWLDGFIWEKTHTRTSEWRIKEALNAGAEILAVTCPYETPRFEDAAKTVPNAGNLKVRDIAELLAEAIG